MKDFVGIDISKSTFHVFAICGEASYEKIFSNDTKGHRQLSTWLRKSCSRTIHLCMEATGIYWEKLAAYLHGEKHEVSVINPSQIKAFAASELLRVKTDSVDAGVIARFCRSNTPPLWSPPAPGVRALQALVRRLGALKRDRQQQLNRFEDLKQEPEIRALIKAFDRAILETARRIRDCVRANKEMQSHSDLLCSIPGIAETTASVLLAEVFLRSDFDESKQVVAYAGLAPRIRQSGSSLRINGGLCKIGNSHVRKALYFPAIVASRCNPVLADFSNRLLAKGKPKMSVIGAVMRKLLVLCYGVLKSGINFNPMLTA